MRFAAASLAALLLLSGAAAAQTTTSHALSLGDAPKYGPGFTQLDYVNVNAPKGGELRLATPGGFDSLNPFIAQGDTAPGIGLVYETLMTQTPDDDLSEYGLIAESVEVPEDLGWVAFTLRPQAKWADGQPITAEDVVWSFAQLKEHGAPHYQLYYANVAKAEMQGPRKVKFSFSGPKNRELPQIIGQLPVLQKSLWEKRGVDKVTLEPWAGSGAYRIGSFEANRHITYVRRDDWWGRDLPVNKGRYNFGSIRYDVYRDQTVMREAFKSGQYDFRSENSGREWAIFYNFPAIQQGLVKKEMIRHERPGGISGFIYNTRRPQFQDVRVRQALTLAWDFEWVNKNLAYDAYYRPGSYFDNSEFAAAGTPSPAELKLLEPLRDRLRPAVFGPAWQPPKSDGSGADRRNLREAARLLKEAGWEVKDGRLVNAKGEPFQMELMLQDASYERMAGPWVQSLQRLGITLTMRAVDSAQYVRRLQDFNYDVVYSGWAQSNSPGNEQRYFFSSAAADNPASRNLAGIRDPAVDALIEAIVAAPSRADLIPAVRALDRVLTWGWYISPTFGLNADRIAWWDKFGMPEKTPKNGVDFMAWWVDPAKAAKIDAARR
ncbi:extracellular solute-binding protein [Ferrovibrio sp.]|uniref:extracellular solute-binding protein n=1 Tax=Ferrovibrio sp. TaxID=1917215 RepID=UPI00311D2F55